jgi:hypothetical protein
VHHLTTNIGENIWPHYNQLNLYHIKDEVIKGMIQQSFASMLATKI